MIIFKWFKKKQIPDDLSEIDLGQKPVYNEEGLEFKKLIDDILMKLDEIQLLVNQLNQESKK